jgi:hypothetical protein|tara:strand:+ start:636 stop:761 length:126 start_codon:yes stop_codon:yes gene_type:complete
VPKVGSKHFSYTPKGYAAAEKYAKKKRKKIQYGKKKKKKNK